MEYSTQPRFLIHQNCAHFRNGFYTLNGVAVNTDGATCPRFTPESITAIPQAVRAYPGAGQPYQSCQPQAGYGYPAPRYHEYIHPLLYIRPPQTGYGYRTRYGSVPVHSALTAPRQGGTVFFSMSSGRRGGGRGGGVGAGRGRGRMGGFAAGPGGSCVCPRCGYSTSHVIGTPCYQQTCPKCGSRMTRGS